MRTKTLLTSLAAMALAACSGAPTEQDGSDLSTDAAPIAAGSVEEAAVLALVNDPTVDAEVLDIDVALDKRAATNIIIHRDGYDEVSGTGDDDLFDGIAELDSVPYVGQSALAKLLAYAQANGYVPGTEAPTEEALTYATLALVNDPGVDVQLLDDDAALDSRAANNIIEWRSGVDGLDGTPDDRTYLRIDQLDAIKYVGGTALGRLRDYAVGHGYLDQVPTGTADAIFSPQEYAYSHNVRIAGLIDDAQHSLDIAMYSYSDALIADALEAAADRGVQIRFIFEKAASDKSKTGTSLDNSKSAALEKMGINVRYVNKIMHHKFMIVDGPRDDLARAATATVVSGSGNWSNGAATRYDENTLFLEGQVELTLRLQQQFNLLWDHSRDFVYDASLPFEQSTATIDDSTISAADEAGSDALFTSDNFNVNGDTFSIVTGRNTISDALVEAIDNATDSIWIASGHLRSRPVAEALMAKQQAHPDMDIRVYLDGQEYISEWYQGVQLDELDDCLAAAGTSASKIRKCYDKGFYFGYQVGQSGVSVRYKYYAFRWNYSYALQMHHKLMIIDGDELWTGSYNLSDNAEHNTFENILVFRGLPFGELIAAYQQNFETIWNTARDDGTYEALIETVQTSSKIPIVFDPMALDWSQVAELKALISANCPDVYSQEFKSNPEQHYYCFTD